MGWVRDGEWQCDSCTVRDNTVSVCDEEENQRCRRGRSEVLGAGIQEGRGPQLRQVRATWNTPLPRKEPELGKART